MQYRWFKISGKCNLHSFGSYLQRNQFIGKEDFSSGFFIEMIGNEFIKSRFIEKSVLSREIELPNQEVFFENYTKLQIIDFLIRDSYLRIDTPAKSYLSLFNFLAESSDFTISISPIQLNLKNFIDYLKDYFDEFNIKYVDINNFQLTKNIVARIAMQGERDVDKILDKILRKGESKIVSLKIDLFKNNDLYTLSITNNMRIKCHSGKFDEIDSIILDGIKKIISN